MNITRIEVDSDVYELAERFVAENNLGMRGVFDGNKRNQFVGILGQVAFYKYLFGTLPDLVSGFDEGIDLVYKEYSFDVKTMERKVFMRDYFVNNFVALQLKYDTDVLLFLSYNSSSNIIEICGWIFKRDLETKATFHPAGSIRTRSDGSTFVVQQDLYEVNQSELNFFYKK